MTKLNNVCKVIALALFLGLGATAQAKLLAAGRAASVTGTVYKYETTHFAIYYQTSGENAVYGSSTVDGNGVPVAIDSIGAYAERSWALAVDTLKYKSPTGMSTTIYYQQATPTGKMPIEVADVGMANQGSPWNDPTMGMSTDPSLDSKGLGCEILLENDFIYNSTKPIRDSSKHVSNGILYDFSTATDIYKGWKVTVSHEFFHTIEFGYEYSYQYSFHEMCAVWFEICAYPEIYHHWTYLPKFVSGGFSGAFATGSSHYYSNHVFVREFAKVFGDSSIRKIWEYRSRHVWLDTKSMTEAPWFSQAMDSLGYSQATLLADYSVELANLLYDHAGLLNDNGLYVNMPYQPSTRLPRTSPVAGIYGQSSIELENFGFDGLEYSWKSIPTGMHFMIDSTNSNSGGFGFLVHMPSLKITQYDPRGKNVIVAIDTGDTAIAAFYAGGNPVVFAYTEFTYDAVTGISSAKKLRNAFIPKTRVDLMGRPVSSDYRGIVIESDGIKTIPTVQVR